MLATRFLNFRVWSTRPSCMVIDKMG